MANRDSSGEPGGTGSGPSVAEERDQDADQRDQDGDQRDQDADQRDQDAVSAGIPTTDALKASAMARREAASDRMRASQDRQAGASERTHAELDRNTALADRGASAREREEQARLDVAARSEQSRRLESLGELAVGVAHDFNNLLGVILNYTTLVAKRVPKNLCYFDACPKRVIDTTAAADLGEIRVAAERAAGLTRQLLTFARRDVANPEPLDVNEIVRAMASMLDRTLGEDIELRVDLAGGPLVAIAEVVPLPVELR